MPENRFVGEIARTYDHQPETGMWDDGVLEATVDCLVELTDGGAAMEFAIGTGRVAVPLAARGVPVAGIELSADMLAVLRSKPEASDITAVEGDMAVTFVEGEFTLVYLVSTPSRVPRSSKAAATWRSRCVSTPPVMLRAKVVTVIPSLVWVGVTPHRAERRTGQRRACVRQAPMRSLRPTGRCRVG